MDSRDGHTEQNEVKDAPFKAETITKWYRIIFMGIAVLVVEGIELNSGHKPLTAEQIAEQRVSTDNAKTASAVESPVQVAQKPNAIAIWEAKYIANATYGEQVCIEVGHAAWRMASYRDSGMGFLDAKNMTTIVIMASSILNKVSPDVYIMGLD